MISVSVTRPRKILIRQETHLYMSLDFRAQHLEMLDNGAVDRAA
jgi:hypothetical protein